LESRRVSGHELQSAVLLVLVLYASIALLDIRAERNLMTWYWQRLLEFCSHLLLVN
jgi:hypothetical protein